MTAGIHSPSTKNLLIGKGVCLLKPEGATDYYPVGNVPSLDITPTVEKLEHFSSMEGTKTKDEVIVLSKSGTIKMVMEEITADNIALLMLGDVTKSGYAGYGAEIALFSRASITSAFLFYGTNDKGPRWKIDIPKVIWNPSGAFSPISDAYAKLEATGEWSALEGDFGTMTLLAEAGTTAPVNVLKPYIGGDLSVGETGEIFVGAWIGASGYTYQWKNGVTNKGTEKTQTFDGAGSWTCVVTATNAIGTTNVTSNAVPVT
jgi:hypothetical protein